MAIPNSTPTARTTPPQPTPPSSRHSIGCQKTPTYCIAIANQGVLWELEGLPQGTTNRHQPPTAIRQPPVATNRQPPTTANRHQPPITKHQPPPTTTYRHQPPVANCQPPIATNRQPPIATNHGCTYELHAVFFQNCRSGTLCFFLGTPLLPIARPQQALHHNPHSLVQGALSAELAEHCNTTRHVIPKAAHLTLCESALHLAPCKAY